MAESVMWPTMLSQSCD